MRSLLANDGYGLTVQWNFIEQERDLHLQHMALGETIGFANLISQGGFEAESDAPTWRDLLGDPTLRMHVVLPASNVVATENGGSVTVTWTASAEEPSDIEGYHIYRAADENSPFERITGSPVSASPYIDPAGSAGNVYMVRTVTLEDTPSGTYFNASQGAFSQPVP